MRNKYIKTSNTTRFLAKLAALQDRGAEEACLMVVDGPPGLGKTETVQWWATQQGVVFLRAKQGWTPSWMLRELLGELSTAPLHTFERMYGQTLEALAARSRLSVQEGGQMAVVIDEVDHIARRTDVLETLRDLSDMLEIPFILVGMDRVRSSLTRHRQIGSRVGQFCEFHPLTPEDTAALVSGLSEVSVAGCMLDFLHRSCGGYIRELKEGIKSIERCGRRNSGAVTVAMMAGQVLLNDRTSGRPITVKE
ncbi:AAA family ATPase [Azospirillum agricola]|uniref:AAA family ATPase n=1 Tax=Azospirillum agricola TaxID=1720247 RepID=UPI000A0EF991|nr:ATP-binding protein [Azospirillum agricola]SMH62874.1 AAA domain-containing protein [Azospirillum lipoferum]